jgi:hypothetical protein
MDVGRPLLVQNAPRTRLDAGTWGTMGIGLGYCIAAAVAEPECACAECTNLIHHNPYHSYYYACFFSLQ